MGGANHKSAFYDASARRMPTGSSYVAVLNAGTWTFRYPPKRSTCFSAPEPLIGCYLTKLLISGLIQGPFRRFFESMAGQALLVLPTSQAVGRPVLQGFGPYRSDDGNKR